MALYAITAGSTELLGSEGDKRRRAPLSLSITAESTELLGSEASKRKSRSICHTQQEEMRWGYNYEVGAQL